MTCKEILDFFKDEKYDSQKILFVYEWIDNRTCYFKLKVNFVKFDTYSNEFDENLKLFAYVENVSREESMTVAELKELAKRGYEMAGDDSYIIFTSNSTKPRLGDCYITRITDCSSVSCEIEIDDYDPDVMECE